MSNGYALTAAGITALTAAVIGGVYVLVNLETVQAGYVGVRVNLYADKGVQNEVAGTGRYFLGMNEKMYQFPTFNQLKDYSEAFS